MFSTTGYDKASPAAIATDAGLTRTAIYSYYQSKVELYQAAFDSIRDDVLGSMVRRWIGAGGTFPVRIGAFLQTAVELHAHDPSIIRFMASAMVDGLRHPELRSQVLGHVEALRAFVHTEVADAQGRGELSGELDAREVADTLISAFWGLGWYAAFIGSADDLSAVARLTLGAMFEGRLKSSVGDPGPSN